MSPLPAPPLARLAGHALVEALVAQGVGLCFGVPGESYLAVLDGFLEHRERIRFITCRHEGGAAFMAEAHGKLTGRPGVCFVTRGPGALNAAIGLHTAFQDSTPMVLFVGQVGSDVRDREAFQELDYRAVFGPNSGGLAKWVGEVQSADRLPEYVSHAFHVALQGRPGPVVLVLPEDMLGAASTAAVLPRTEPARCAPAAADLLELRALLQRAERPLVIAGGSGWDAAAVESLQRFAERWHLPVACAFRFQDRFDNRHPLYAGDVGIGIDPALARRVVDADLVLALGPRLGEMTTAGYTLLEAPRPKQTLVHIHAGSEELGRVYRGDLAIQSCMAEATAALAALEAPPTVRWRAWAQSAHADHDANRVAEAVVPLDLAQVVATLQRLAPADAIVANGAGNFSGWLHRYWRYAGLGTQLAPTSGAMGYGVPAAIAASLLAPGRCVIAVTGDGDFLMTGQELATARAHGAKIVVVLVDNASYGTIRMHQERRFPGRVSASDLTNPDFVLLARAHGFAAERVEASAAFEPAFAAALARRESTLLHLVLDVDVATSRTTLGAIRADASRRHASS